MLKFFFFAGHETTATLLSHAFHFLVKYPEAYKKLQAEVDSVVGKSKEITLDHVDKLVYVQAIIKETLRLKGPVNALFRQPLEDSQLGDYTIPKTVRVVLLFDALHRDKNYWEKPDEFIPERWFQIDETKARGDGYYMPFSAGQRICVGQRLAREETILFLVMVAQRFNIKPAYDVTVEPIADINSFTFKPKCIKIIVENKN